MDPDGNRIFGFLAGMIAGALGFGQLYSTLTMVIGIARSIQAIANGADPKAVIGSWLLGYAISAVINPIVNGVLKGISRVESSYNLGESTGLVGRNRRGDAFYSKSISLENQSFIDQNTSLSAVSSHPDFEAISNQLLELSRYKSQYVNDMVEVSGWLHLKNGQLTLVTYDIHPNATHYKSWMVAKPKVLGGILVHVHTHPSAGLNFYHAAKGKILITRSWASPTDMSYTAKKYGVGFTIGGNRKVYGYSQHGY